MLWILVRDTSIAVHCRYGRERVESLSTHLYDPIMLGVVLFFKTETAKTVTMLFTVSFHDSTMSLWGSFPGWIFDSQFYTGYTVQFRYKFTGTIASFRLISVESVKRSEGASPLRLLLHADRRVVSSRWQTFTIVPFDRFFQRSLLERGKMLKNSLPPRSIRNSVTIMCRNLYVETHSFVNPQVSFRIWSACSLHAMLCHSIRYGPHLSLLAKVRKSFL